MPRIRTIKPEFFTSASVARLSYRARLTWQGIWTQVDDGGRMRYDPRVLAGAIWPQEDDVTWREVASDVEELRLIGVVIIYGPDGEYLAVTNWHEHQRINKATASKLPTPPVTEHSGSTTGVVTDKVFHNEPVENEGADPYRGEVEVEVEEEVEVEGDAQAPTTPFCSLHPQGTDQPCRTCQVARLAWRRDVEKWNDRAAVPTMPPPRTYPDCPTHPGYPMSSRLVSCPRCAEESAA